MVHKPELWDGQPGRSPEQPFTYLTAAVATADKVPADFARPYELKRYAFGEFSTEMTGQLLREVADGLTAAIRPFLPVDRIVSPEPGGNGWGMIVACVLNVPLVVLRQHQIFTTQERGLSRRTAYSDGRLFADPLPAGSEVIVLDDVVSSGGTLDAILEHVRACEATTKLVQTILTRGQAYREVARKHNVHIRGLTACDE